MANASYGQNPVTGNTSDYNAMQFQIQQKLAAVNSATLVKIAKVTTSGKLEPVGYVDVTPQVNLVDGIGQPTGHETVYHLPYVRMQGGTNAVILDPKVGDLGLVVFCDRDISAVKANNGVANPGSKRRFAMSDGVYIGSWMSNVKPTSVVRFGDDGTIYASVGETSPAELVVAATHVQMKKNGSPTLHFTVDIAAGQLSYGMLPVIAPDPYPSD